MADGRQANPHSRRPNYSYIEEQNEARTDLLNSKVSQLKHLAVQIGEETKYQNKYLKVRMRYYDRRFGHRFSAHSRNCTITWKTRIV